jgi:hypothetical protein
MTSKRTYATRLDYHLKNKKQLSLQKEIGGKITKVLKEIREVAK